MSGLLITGLTPLNTPSPRRLSLFDRTLSTPPVSPTSTTYTPSNPSSKDQSTIRSILTPPTSPRLTRSSDDLPGILTERPCRIACPPTPRTSGEDSNVLSGRAKLQGRDQYRRGDLIECAFDVDFVKDQRGRDQKYGTGAWSTVYKAIGHEKRAPMSALLTPPGSPIQTVPVLVAVKKPARRDAVAIIRSEGAVLSHLASIEGHGAWVITFYGFLPAIDSLVLAPIPLSLEEHIRKCASQAYPRTTTWSSPGPVIGGSATWLDLAHQLVSALAWLHTVAGVVHGDIKPGNILLSPKRSVASDPDFAFTPLFADFTSSQFLDAPTVTPNTLSAITREYTAPELLSSAVLKDPNSTATTASDVFSLAVTLLVAATGELMVYPGSVWQRQAMATQGWYILSNVRNGDQGLRIPIHGLVDQVLETAVLKVGMGRIDASSWRQLVEGKMLAEPEES